MIVRMVSKTKIIGQGRGDRRATDGTTNSIKS